MTLTHNYVRTSLKALLTVSTLLALGCGASNQATVDVSQDDAAAFGRYRVWAIAGPEALPDGFGRVELDVMQLEQLRDLARDILEVKGYREGTIHNADIVFFAGLGQRTAYRVEHAPRRYRDADGVYEAEVARNEQTGPTEETLVLDGFERPSMFHVYQGRATVPNVHDNYEAAVEALRAILEQFPAADPNAAPWASGDEVTAAEAEAEAEVEAEVVDGLEAAAESEAE